jgi:hypothetical protein
MPLSSAEFAKIAAGSLVVGGLGYAGASVFPKAAVFPPAVVALGLGSLFFGSMWYIAAHFFDNPTPSATPGPSTQPPGTVVT